MLAIQEAVGRVHEFPEQTTLGYIENVLRILFSPHYERNAAFFFLHVPKDCLAQREHNGSPRRSVACYSSEFPILTQMDMTSEQAK